jgi:hypothetical protein
MRNAKPGRLKGRHPWRPEKNVEGALTKVLNIVNNKLPFIGKKITEVIVWVLRV